MYELWRPGARAPLCPARTHRARVQHPAEGDTRARKRMRFRHHPGEEVRTHPPPRRAALPRIRPRARDAAL